MSAKAKAAGVNVSSFWDLKAELSKQQTSLAAKKASGGQLSLKGGVPRPEKKVRKGEQPNKGVAQRAAADSTEWAKLERPTYEAAQAALARKAKVYSKLKKGQTGGLTEGQYDALLVDFDEKRVNDHYESDSDDVDESLTVPTGPDADDPIVEYQDEFGRVRSVKRSEVPREYMAALATSALEDDDPYVIHGPMNHFPVYEPDAERLAAIKKAAEEVDSPLASHYDSTREIRAKGAAFYQFSADEQERQRQLEELKQKRDETVRTRQELGAVDAPVALEPDMGGGPIEPEEPAKPLQSRAMEKRKRDIEARKQAIEAKRRKREEATSAANTEAKEEDIGRIPVVVADDAMQVGDQEFQHTATPTSSKALPLSAADDFLANLEREMVQRR